MPSNNQFPEQPDPLAPLGELMHWVGSTALHCALGLALGAVAARLMRRHHMHWSWAALSLVFFVFAGASLPASQATLMIAALVATVRGRRWHRHDIDSGVDLREIAHARLRPVDLLRRLVACAAARLRIERVAGERRDDAYLALGSDERGRTVLIPFGGAGGGQHTLVVGATGSGKTVTQTRMAVSAIERGMGAVVIDPKGDGGMRDQLERAARAAGRRYLEWTPSGPCVYNPYACGSDTEISDKTLAGERFTEPHYLRQAQRYMGHVVRALHSGGHEVSLAEIVRLLDPARLEVLARTLPEYDARPLHAYLDSLTTRQQSELSGVRDRLSILVESDVGRWLDPLTDSARRFDLLGAIREQAVVYFSLDADRRPLLAQMLGAAVVQDLQTTVAASQARPVPTIVVIDEFSAVAASQVVRLFGRARSAGLSLVLGTQEISDLRLPGEGKLLEQIMGNLSAVIAHRQVVPTSAELISSVAGTQGVWKVSRHSDGRSTRTRAREAALDSDRVMGLGRGWAAVIVLGSASRVRIAHVFSPRPTA
jgi:conjugal transfer pilus assembly protein TraD